VVGFALPRKLNTGEQENTTLVFFVYQLTDKHLMTGLQMLCLLFQVANV
jgi:hypothetical protein